MTLLFFPNLRYLVNAQKQSKIFRDRPENPLKSAVYWSEYVIRHKGAPQLRSAARNLTDFQYHSVDVIVFLVAAFFAVLGLTMILVKLCCLKCRKQKTTKYDLESMNKKRA